jgi:hypothetical protein
MHAAVTFLPALINKDVDTELIIRNYVILDLAKELKGCTYAKWKRDKYYFDSRSKKVEYG